MSMDTMNARVSTYFDLMAQIEQLQAEAETIKDELKGQMMERETEELEGNLAQHQEQPVRQQAVQDRPRRPVRPVHGQDHRHPVHAEPDRRMKKAPYPTSRPKRLDMKP